MLVVLQFGNSFCFCFSALGGLFLPKFFRKLFRTEKAIGANTLEHFLLHGMGLDGRDISPSTSMSSGPRPSNTIVHGPLTHRIKTA